MQSHLAMPSPSTTDRYWRNVRTRPRRVLRRYEARPGHDFNPVFLARIGSFQRVMRDSTPKSNSPSCMPRLLPPGPRGLQAARKGFQAGRKEFQAARKEFQASRKEFQASRKEFQASRKEFQTQRKEIQISCPCSTLGFSMGYRRILQAWELRENCTRHRLTLLLAVDRD
jgi:hypothetical protein